MSIIVCTGAPFEKYPNNSDQFTGGSGYRENRICRVYKVERGIVWPASNQKNLISNCGIYTFACRPANEVEIKEYLKHGDHILKPSIQERIKNFKI